MPVRSPYILFYDGRTNLERELRWERVVLEEHATGASAFSINPTLYEPITTMVENACTGTQYAAYAHSIANGESSWGNAIANLYDDTGSVETQDSGVLLNKQSIRLYLPIERVQSGSFQLDKKLPGTWLRDAGLPHGELSELGLEEEGLLLGMHDSKGFNLELR